MGEDGKNSETELQRRHDERSKRKEDRCHVYPSATVKHAGSLIHRVINLKAYQEKRTALNKAVPEYGYAEAA